MTVVFMLWLMEKIEHHLANDTASDEISQDLGKTVSFPDYTTG